MSADPDLISVLTPYLSVCKRSDTARREKKLTRFRIYGAILSNKEFKKLTAEKRKWLKEWSRLERDPGKAMLQELVQRYIDRLREEAADHDKKRFDSNSVPIQKFQKIAEDMLETDPAWFSFFSLTTKTDDSCFVGLVQKHLKAESGDIENMTFYFLEDGVKESNTGGAAGGKEEGAMGGAAIQTHVHVATLVLPLDWEKSFAKSLKNNIHNCHGHVGPALEALRAGRDSYTDLKGKSLSNCRDSTRPLTFDQVMMAASWVPAWLESLLLFLIPHSCIEELLVNFNIFHVECLKTLISKVLGYGIILGSSIVKVPQVIKILVAKSAEGISIYGVLLELTAITNTLAYSYANKYPFSAYGEALFMLLQTAAIAFMVLYFQGKHATAVGFLGSYAAILSYLLSGMAPMSVLATLHATGMPVVLVSKMIQAIANYRQGHTGQLSAITVFLLTLGSMARIFTSHQETGDTLLIMTYVVSTAANALIALQIVWYWNVVQKPKAE
ncbi:MPDU1 [Branchiostoma lanceolatum]|uniref:MPDU1 protein n=1 Tax=Branchiostoma lanceolatum TaxID=7740 RepID=A0A8J9Z0W5_BRALA|nr:MPDU1 [Branchiostoma lanceolatum]